MTWLELLDGDTHNPFMLNMNRVLSIQQFQEGTLLLTATPDGEGIRSYFVRESPDEIAERLIENGHQVSRKNFRRG